jgi:hypothetical protein
MCERLELVREEKLYRLLPGQQKNSRLEASGVALIDDRTALVVFDNLRQVARVELSLEPRQTNRLLPAPGLGPGFEDIAMDARGGRVFCLIEALEDGDGRFRGFVVEYDVRGRFVRCTSLSPTVENENKGFEGLTHVRRRGREYLLALREGSPGAKARRGGCRIDAFTPTADGGWEFSHWIRLPQTAEFEDHAAIAWRDGCLAVVSQASARVWVARLDQHVRRVVPGSDAVYRFPKKSYGNVEGIAWLSEDTLVAVSDRKKAGQLARCARKDQSIHVFRIPGPSPAVEDGRRR